MTTKNALEAARAFSRMPEHSQDRKVRLTAHSLAELDGQNVSLVQEGFEIIARALLEMGRVGTYKNLDLHGRLSVIETWFTDTAIETLFLIDDAKRGVSFATFVVDREISFQEFDTELFHVFDRSFRKFGSDDFRQSLYRYFQMYGSCEYLDKNGNRVTENGGADGHITLAAFALREVYGESKIIALLDRIVSEQSPIRALDFIKLIKSRNDYSSYPLGWAGSLAD